MAQAFGDFYLFLVNALGDASIRVFNWYAESRYDKMYQGIVAVEELPNSHLLIVSVHREIRIPSCTTPTRKKKLGS